MKTEKELEKDIMNITMEINNEFPELSKYITEMPSKVPRKGNVEINNKSLSEYYNSLKELLLKYREEQGK